MRTFKDQLGDWLTLTLAKCINLEDKLLDTLNHETALASLTTAEKEWLLRRITIANDMTYE